MNPHAIQTVATLAAAGLFVATSCARADDTDVATTTAPLSASGGSLRVVSSAPAAATAAQVRRPGIGDPRPPPGMTLAPPEVNTKGPTDFTLQAGVADDEGNYSTEAVLSSNAIRLVWVNNDDDPRSTTTIYRTTLDGHGVASAATPIETFGALPLGVQVHTDTTVAPDTFSCFYILGTNAAGVTAYTPRECAYMRDGLNHKPARVQLSITVGNSASHTTRDPVYVRLQSDVFMPRGNFSWLASTAFDFEARNTTYTYDLSAHNIRDLTDITEVSIGVDGSDDLCVANLRLFVDDCGNGDGCGLYRTLYYKDFVQDTGHCASAVNSLAYGVNSTVDVSFMELRSFSDWPWQVQHWDDVTPHFAGYANGGATKAVLMGLIANAMHDHGVSLNDLRPIELSVSGRANERLTVMAHVHKTCDAWVQLDLVLRPTCDCVYDPSHIPAGTYNFITSTKVVVENVSGDVEGLACSLGVFVVDLITDVVIGGPLLGMYLEELIEGRVMSAANSHSPTYSTAPPHGLQWAFTTGPAPASRTNPGFLVAPGQDCFETNPACGLP